MRCAALHTLRDIRVIDAPDPIPRVGECMVQITGVGICGSDIHWYREGAIGDATLERPLILGHEMAGIVRSGPMEGQTVGLDPAVPCGHCRECLGGLEHLCEQMRFAGHGPTDGALCELMAWPEARVHRLPDGFDGAQGALLEPLGVAVHSVDLGHLRHGTTVAVVGCGPIGLMIIQLAAMAGCRVVAVEPLAHRRDAAVRAGATEVMSPTTEGESGFENGCDVAFEVSGTDDGLERSARLVRPGARVVIVGIPCGDRTTFRASLVRRKGLTLALARRMTEGAYERAIALGTSGAVDLAQLVTHRFALAEAEQAFDVADRQAGLKVVIDVDAA